MKALTPIQQIETGTPLTFQSVACLPQEHWNMSQLIISETVQ